MAEKLAFLDEKYLSHFDCLKVDSEIRPEPAFEKPARSVREFPISEGENVEENTYLVQAFSMGDTPMPSSTSRITALNSSSFPAEVPFAIRRTFRI